MQPSSTAPVRSPWASDPTIQQPTDAVVRVVMGCVCGSDLWYHRGESDHVVGSIGHEFIGVVEDIGTDVEGVRRVTSSSSRSSTAMTAVPTCQHGSTTACAAGGTFGDGEIDGGQGEAVRVPLAGSTLVPVPGSGHADDMLKSLLTLETDLDGIGEAYAAMDDRRAIKSLVRVGSI